MFSAIRFPRSEFKLEWRREDASGNVYYSRDLDAEAWLCPALLRYFEQAPSEIYVQVKAKVGAGTQTS